MLKTHAQWLVFIFPLIVPIITLIAGLHDAGAGAEPAASARAEAGEMLDKVLADPQKYLNEEITVAGVLQAMGHGSNSRFFLAGPEGKALAVQPWAPLELSRPPTSQTGRPLPKSMRYFVGRRLLLTGKLQKGKEKENYIFKVRTAEEL